ncbi:TPA: hypothetical protein DCL28_02570 [Candidatus Komeilibacteria bacterium]|nr:MAG: hypothetical protein A2260_04130 [Candidatus Komeilibacteria bacterium RIFOXYA2_FULL_45_9]OGY94757.1 MAG: hypothetical protein A3J95_01205 [Candidatus Komeilibacteria bacterium RIFOXYC2_FULL_45_12]HAH04418.1 hypothetical protein [Candidatus Komeilibacteria bacterium]HBR13420.1 hypothetical protein [Candidatus Komeilibacteria bacterium]HBV02544.1 hypothetical protein [Candidatus Komeilibacteria bacterium]
MPARPRAITKIIGKKYCQLNFLSAWICAGRGSFLQSRFNLYRGSSRVKKMVLYKIIKGQTKIFPSSLKAFFSLPRPLKNFSRPARIFCFISEEICLAINLS